MPVHPAENVEKCLEFNLPRISETCCIAVEGQNFGVDVMLAFDLIQKLPTGYWFEPHYSTPLAASYRHCNP